MRVWSQERRENCRQRMLQNYQNPEFVNKMNISRVFVGKKLSLKLLKGKTYEQLYPQIVLLAESGLSGVQIGKKLDITQPTVYKIVQINGNYNCLQTLEKNMIRRKLEGGHNGKGKSSTLKGKTYLEIFGDPIKAKARAEHTAAWMRTDKNIRKHCKHPSKPQIKVYDIVKKYYPTAEMEYSIPAENRIINLDIAIPELNIDVEYDGIYWHTMNNNDGESLTDEKRDKILTKLGWKVIRISGDINDVISNQEIIEKLSKEGLKLE
jgi:hypothetical protein